MTSFDPKNVSASPDVAVRPARRQELAGLRSWGRHPEPYLAEYNVPLLSDADLDDLWRTQTGGSDQLLYHALAGDQLVAQIKLRDFDRGGADFGIMMDARFVGRGLGKSIIGQTLAIVFGELGLERDSLEVAGYNQRAVATYRACGFVETGREWVQLDSRVDFAGLLRQPELAWLDQWVRVEGGVTRILVLAMEARHRV